MSGTTSASPAAQVLHVQEVDARVLRLLRLSRAVVLGGPPDLGEAAALLVLVAYAVAVGVALVIVEHAVAVEVEHPVGERAARGAATTFDRCRPSL